MIGPLYPLRGNGARNGGHGSYSRLSTFHGSTRNNPVIVVFRRVCRVFVFVSHRLFFLFCFRLYFVVKHLTQWFPQLQRGALNVDLQLHTLAATYNHRAVYSWFSTNFLRTASPTHPHPPHSHLTSKTKVSHSHLTSKTKVSQLRNMRALSLPPRRCANRKEYVFLHYAV